MCLTEVSFRKDATTVTTTVSRSAGQCCFARERRRCQPMR
jgi:hypothetical protein